MMPNITVKAVSAFGLHWTSRKRAALYLQRYPASKVDSLKVRADKIMALHQAQDRGGADDTLELKRQARIEERFESQDKYTGQPSERMRRAIDSPRGRTKVNTQWNLYCMGHNIEKLSKTSLGYQRVQ